MRHSPIAIRPSLIATAALLLSGCVAPGMPYSGSIPSGALLAGSIPHGQNIQSAYYSPPTGYYPGALPFTYAPAPCLIPPAIYGGYGNGYWYGRRFWPYRPGCAFYGGRYYGGYPANYWRRNNGY